MATDRQIRANQLNALRSTGPRTEAGKEACSRNALRHGLTARQIVLEDEDPAEYEALREALLDELSPLSAMEGMLIDRLAQLFWRLRRIPRFESAFLAWNDAFDRRRHNSTALTLGGVFISCETSSRDPACDRDHAAGDQASHARRMSGRALEAAFLDGDVLNKLSRYERELMRQVERVLDALAKGRGQIAVGRLLGRRRD